MTTDITSFLHEIIESERLSELSQKLLIDSLFLKASRRRLLRVICSLFYTYQDKKAPKCELETDNKMQVKDTATYVNEKG